MLEQHGLIVGPWQSAAGSNSTPRVAAGPMRRVFDAATKTPLGLVRCRPRSGWFLMRWLERQVWDVLETEDESLLLSVYCPWGLLNPWEIYDAEDHLVCTITDGHLFDSTGQLRVRLKSNADKHSFITTDNDELAALRSVPEGIELVFTDVVYSDPFAKMALLGATLTVAEKLAARGKLSGPYHS